MMAPHLHPHLEGEGRLPSGAADEPSPPPGLLQTMRSTSSGAAQQPAPSRGPLYLCMGLFSRF
jgi:hypothetical protein